MNPNVVALWISVLSLSVFGGTISAASPSPEERFAALMEEYNPAGGGLRDATTDRERKEAVDRLAAYSSKFVDLAESSAGDEVALKALKQAVQAACSTDSAALTTWETNRSDFPGGCNDGSAAKTVAILMRDHVLSGEVGPVCDRMRYSYRLECAKFLRAVLERNPNREVRGLACLCLARFLNDRLQMLRMVDDNPDLAHRYEVVFGNRYLPGLRALEKEGVEEEIESLFERAAGEYGDVKIPIGGTSGEQAESELYGIRRLAIGRAAPDAGGRDQDGIEFSLDDCRGKVVLLYFWMEL